MRAKIVSNFCIKGPYYKLILKPAQNIEAIPGQFFMIRPVAYHGCSEPLLPRPFSIHRLTPEGNIAILYKVVGKGTTLLSHADAGDDVEILGSLGNGFPVIPSSDEILIVAGGIGVAPMLYLTESLRTFLPGKKITVFLGGKEETDLLCVEELGKVATEVILATQDGSIGVNGYVTDTLEWYLHKRSPETPATVYACGPNPMLKRIAEIVTPLKIDTYFSLEATMACGIGICMGCAVKRKGGGYFLVCKEGPVFKGETIDFE